MPNFITIDGAQVPVPTDEELPDNGRLRQLQGRVTKRNLSSFVFSLLTQNEITFRSHLKEHVKRWKTSHKKPLEEMEDLHNLWQGLTDHLACLATGVPFSDEQLEGAIRIEFADYPTVIDALDNGTYRIAEFRSKYRRGVLLKGSDARYASFAYVAGMPVDRAGGHNRHMTVEEFIDVLQEFPLDPGNQLFGLF